MELIKAFKSLIEFYENHQLSNVIQATPVVSHIAPVVVNSKPIITETLEEAPKKAKKERKAFVWTQKREEAFKKCRETRAANLEKKRKEREQKEQEQEETLDEVHKNEVIQESSELSLE